MTIKQNSKAPCIDEMVRTCLSNYKAAFGLVKEALASGFTAMFPCFISSPKNITCIVRSSLRTLSVAVRREKWFDKHTCTVSSTG